MKKPWLPRKFASRQLWAAVSALIFALLAEWINPGLLAKLEPYALEIILFVVSAAAGIDTKEYVAAQDQEEPNS